MVVLWTTMWLSAISSVLALLIGLIAGLFRVSKNFTLRWLSTIYVNSFAAHRCWSRFSSLTFRWHGVQSGRNVAGIGALSIFAGAYVAEMCGPAFRLFRPDRWRLPGPWG